MTTATLPDLTSSPLTEVSTGDVDATIARILGESPVPVASFSSSI